MTQKDYLLEQMTWPEALEAFRRTSVVVLPIGSTEQHGPHMPVGTDFWSRRIWPGGLEPGPT